MILDLSKASAEGFFKITDKLTGEILRDQHNAVHFGNLSASLAKALAGDIDGHARYMVFGNGGTSITTTGQIFYRSPNVSSIRDVSAALYNQTFSKDMSVNTDTNNISFNLSNANFADVQFKATINFGEPSGQESTDTAINNDGDFVFDELGIQSHEGVLLTHVVFHPVQKSLNRVIEIDYTLRIQMG